MIIILIIFILSVNASSFASSNVTNYIGTTAQNTDKVSTNSKNSMLKGRAKTNRNKTTYYDKSGIKLGTSIKNNDKITFSDKSGRITKSGKIHKDKAVFYDKSGRKISTLDKTNTSGTQFYDTSGKYKGMIGKNSNKARSYNKSRDIEGLISKNN